MLFTGLFLISAHLVVSLDANKCGTPPVYQDKQLDEKSSARHEFHDGEKVYYKCVLGYTPKPGGSRESRCHRGQWTFLDLQCVRKTCGSAGDIQNGRFDMDGNLFGDRAYAVCNEGYVLQGDAVRECLVHGWSGTVPSCVAVTCKPFQIQYGKVTMHNERYNTQARITCNKGFTLNGPDVVSCANGSWMPGLPVCVRAVNCQPLRIQHGKVMKDKARNQAVITCNRGFMLRGPNVVTCGADGVWMPVLPVCVPEVQCQIFRIENGNVRKDKYRTNTQTITCHRGFMLSGPNAVTCASNGSWVPALPMCVREVQCQPFSIQNGNVRKDKHRINTQIITCHRGFMLRGPNTVTCASNGSWIPALPMCVQGGQMEMTCPPPAVPNSKVLQIFKPYRVGEIAIIYCQDNFMLRGSSEARCGPNGQWKLNAQCVPAGGGQMEMTCPPPAVPNSKGLHIYKTYRVGEIAVIYCQDNFMLRGSSEARCGPNGQWQLNAQCVPAGGLPGRCSHPKYPANAHPGEHSMGNYETYESGASVRFKCDYGYRLASGSDTMYCRNGQWTPSDMRCEKKRCGSAGEILNGRFQYTGASFGDTATAVCDEGYLLVGYGTRNCKAEGWDGKIPECEAVQCPQPPMVPGAEVYVGTSGMITYHQTASYRCRNGRLIGDSDIYCTKHGNWSGPPPHCQEPCPKPMLMGGLIVSGFRHSYQSGNVVAMRCNPGYKLLGSGVITCGEDGVWKPGLPHCMN